MGVTLNLSSTEIAKESTRGSLILFVGNVLSTAISAANVVIIARLLGPDSYGKYTLALVIPNILLLFAGLGVNLAVTRYSAYHLSKGETGRAAAITRRATVFMVLLGIIIALANYYGAPYFSEAILKRGDLAPLVQLVSISIIGQTLSLSATSALVGWSAMAEVSGFTVMQAALKLAISPPLILLGLGIYGALVGHVFSFLVAGGAATFILYAFKLRVREKEKIGFLRDIRTMLAYCLPIFAGSLSSGLAHQYLTILLAAIAANAVVGYYSAGLNVIAAITVISSAVSTMLFRSFAALDGLKSDLGVGLDYAIRYVSYLLTPVVFFLVAGASVLFGMLYGPLYAPGILLLQLLAIANLPVAIGMSVISSFFSGVGRSRIAMLLSIVGAASLVVAGSTLSILLRIGVEGIIYALLISNALSTVLGLIIATRRLHAHINFRPLASIVVASLLACGSVLLVSVGRLPTLQTLVLDIVVYAFVYLTTAPLLRAIDDEDAMRLIVATREIRIIGGILMLVFSYERRLLRLVIRQS